MADLEIRNLHVSAGDKQILKGLDLAVSKGEIHALMGPNGSGKSTLANTLLANPAYEVTRGSIRFRGEDVTALSRLPGRAHLQGQIVGSIQAPLGQLTGLISAPFQNLIHVLTARSAA